MSSVIDGRKPPVQAPLAARLLHPSDDVATALQDLPRGALVRLIAGSVVRHVSVTEDIAFGHKFAVRDLAAGLRIRKYGESIGRATQSVAAGDWVHVHNLETSARQGAAGHALDQTKLASLVQPSQVLGEGRCCVGENPLFDEEHNCLFWIDVRQTPAIHRIDFKSGAQTTWTMSEDIGSLALAGGHRLLIALRSGFAFFDCTTGAIEAITDPEPDLPGNRLNDGRCDPAGRYWCGSMNPDTGTADGSLYMLDQQMGCRKVLDDIITPNGITWSLDGATMYLADTRRGRIHAYDFNLRDGALAAGRIFADLGAMPGGPDGATVDVEGFLWSAQFDGACLVRFAPEGTVDRIVRLPVSKPTACAFGGTGYRQLFVTTATRGLSDAELRDQPLAGKVLVFDVGVTGAPPVRFGGLPRREEGGS